MYQTFIPISMTTVDERTLPIYLEKFKKYNAKRVFLCGIGNVYTEYSMLKTEPARIARAISYFRENGIEVGIWISAFGHGGPLFDALDGTEKYTPIEGINGDRAGHALCPLDPDFLRDYQTAIREIAALSPDLIMLDDDFRLNVRARDYHFGCFCKHHLAKLYERIGKTVPRKALEELILCGGDNPYRTAYLEVSAESLLNFARALRSALNEVAPHIRLGTCATPETWDICGTDLIEISKAFAGNTLPFARISGAPYWSNDIIPIIEFSRQQYAWGKGSGVELFSEGDLFPRPRYAVPSKPLELFDMALIADGTADGMLHYILDYSRPPEYENGYEVRYDRNRALCREIAELFADKHPVGVRVCHSMHKIKRWELPKKLPKKLFTDLQRCSFSPAQYLLSQNSISTAYDQTGYPALVLGVNATDVNEQDLRHGAILDVEAAKILQQRGIDTGLVCEEKQSYHTEYFEAPRDEIPGISQIATRKITCRESAIVKSRFMPDNTPASYLYENEKGLRFFVLAYDHYASHEQSDSIVHSKNPCTNYFNNYYRQADLISAIEWLGKKPLPAVCEKNPNLYVLASKNESGRMSVALCNVSIDDVLDPTVKLDRFYANARFLNCTGKLTGNCVTLSTIPPYGFAAFEVGDPQ